MADLNLRQLEVFVAIEETGSFTAAAQALFLSQSTVSAHIQSLEEALGVTLFDRYAKKRVVLTDDGREVYESARDIVDRCRALRNTFTPDHREELLVAASTVPSKCLLPKLMADFLTLYPDCRYTLRKADTAAVHQMLCAHTVSVGFVGAVLDDSHFVYYPLLDDKLVLLTAGTAHFYELKARGVLGRELLREPMVTRETGSGTRSRFGAYLESTGFDPHRLNIVAQIDDPDAILSAVASGVGVTVYSERAAAEALASGRLLKFELDNSSFYRKIYLVIRRNSSLTRLEQHFIRFARSQAAHKLPAP